MFSFRPEFFSGVYMCFNKLADSDSQAGVPQ